MYAAVKGTTTQSANTGQTASQLLWGGADYTAGTSDPASATLPLNYCSMLPL